VLISDVTNSGAMPALEQMFAFAGARQRLLAHNIANIETPGFRPLDVSVRGFQASLADAIAKRRGTTGGERGDLDLQSTAEVEQTSSGSLLLHPETPSGNILYHDRNDRDVERMMKDLAENTLTFRLTGDLIRHQNDILRAAISQRV